jgi:diadenosine tetraphosphate (Ap4A) HIT family hydrolase
LNSLLLKKTVLKVIFNIPRFTIAYENMTVFFSQVMNENDDNEKNIKCYHMHVHPRNDSWAEPVLANIYYFIDVSLKKGWGV